MGPLSDDFLYAIFEAELLRTLNSIVSSDGQLAPECYSVPRYSVITHVLTIHYVAI